VISFSFLSTLPTKNGTALSAFSSSNKTTIELGAGVAAAVVLVLLLAAACRTKSDSTSTKFHPVFTSPSLIQPPSSIIV
jgi:hypothetical protein